VNAKTPGRVALYLPPGGYNVRVDSYLYSGCEVSPFYDALLAKVIVYARNRSEGITRMQRALDEFILEGVVTNIPLQKSILAHPRFQGGDFGTDILSHILQEEKN
jgi:acetyl-CoA carboxylase biotin carboxylase subunit